MKTAAGIIGLIIGVFSLMYVGVFGAITGSAAGWAGSAVSWLGSHGPSGNSVAAGGSSISDWAEMVKLLSWLAPLLAISGGGLSFRVPLLGGLLLAGSAFCHYQLLGFGSIGNLFILSLGVAAVLAFLDGLVQAASDSNVPAPNIPFPAAAAQSANTVSFDRSKWDALVNYDEDIGTAAARVSPFGSKWVDELGKSYLVLGDKSYLPGIVDKITAKAEEEVRERARSRAEHKAHIEALEQKRKRAGAARQERLQRWTRRSSEFAQYLSLQAVSAWKYVGSFRYGKWFAIGGGAMLALFLALIFIDPFQPSDAEICKAALERARGAVSQATTLIDYRAGYYQTSGRRGCDAQLYGAHFTIAVDLKCDDLKRPECLTLYGLQASDGTWTVRAPAQGSMSASGDSQQPSSATALYTTRFVNLRSAPTSIGATVVGTMQGGQRVSGSWVTANGGTTRWLKVRQQDGSYSYIWGNNLSPTKPAESSSVIALWTDQLSFSPSVVLKKDFAAEAAWHGIVPRKYAKSSWVYDLDGTFNPPKIMSEGGVSYAVGGDCKPYDCATYNTYYVIEPGGHRAYGAVLIVKNNEPTYEYFGNADPLQHEWLREEIVNTLHALNMNQSVN
jgi:hypothetical protein